MVTETAALPLTLTLLVVGGWTWLLYAVCRLEMGRHNAVSVAIVSVSMNVIVMAIWVWFPV